MKSLHLSQIISGSLLLTGLTIISFSTSSIAQTEDIKNHQIGRHELSTPTSMSFEQRTKSMSDEGIGGGTNNPETSKTTDLKNYQIGRHGL
jgi:hypothetical protein